MVPAPPAAAPQAVISQRPPSSVPPEANPRKYEFVRFLGEGGFGLTVVAKNEAVYALLVDEKHDGDDGHAGLCVVAFGAAFRVFFPSSNV